MLKNPPDGIQRVTVRIAYQDIPEALRFLDSAFGFAERQENRLEGPDGYIIVTEIEVVDAYIMIGPAGSHDLGSPVRVGCSTESLMVYVDDVDEHYRVAKANGATIISAPSDQYWGDRRYEAKDIEGHLWFFHQRTKAIPRDEIDRIEASFKQA